MSDQWDPKYPRTGETWEEGYLKASDYIHDPASGWSRAFAAIVQADQNNEFREIRGFYDWLGWPPKVTRLGDARLALWDLYCIPMFKREVKEWPSYARAAYDAALASPMLGLTDGIPPEWVNNDQPRVRAFKTTVLFIAGLIEDYLSPAPELKEILVARFIEQRVAQRLSAAMSSLLQELNGTYLSPVGARRRC